MKTLMLLTLIAAGALAQTCPFAPVGLDVQYLGHAPGTMNARFRVEVPVDGNGFRVLARDPRSGSTETWWTGGSEDSAAGPSRIFVGEASSQSFPSGCLVLELWAGNTDGNFSYMSLCASTGPIPILQYVDGALPYGPIMTGANRATLEAVSVDGTQQASSLLIRVSGAAPGDEGVLVVSHRAAFESFLGGTLLVHPAFISGILQLRADQSGEANLVILGPATTDLPRLYLQAAFGADRLSNGLRLNIQ